MLRRKSFCLVLVCGLLLSGAAVRASIREDIQAATKQFRDVSLVGKVAYANLRELQKIGRDFPKSYDLKTANIQYKAPDKMRVEGKLGIVNVVMLINGDTKEFLVPAVRIKSRENIAGKPHQRQTELDLGIITGSLWDNYVVKDATDDNGKYKIVCVRSNARDKNIICWVEPGSCRLLKIEHYEDDGTLKTRYIYSNHHESQGIWVPGRIDVYNRDGKLAGSTVYEKIRVNGGIADSQFAIAR